MRRFLATALVTLLGLTAQAAVASATAPGTQRNFELVGHTALGDRGMNSAIALYRNYVYVGSRTDGSPGHLNPSVEIVDASDPRRLRVVGQIGAPDEGIPGYSSRELRVWPRRRLLIVANEACSAYLHSCTAQPGAMASFAFYDIGGRYATHPRLVSTYHPPTGMAHEFYVWFDPKRPNRAILYHSTYTVNPAVPSFVAVDISRAREGIFREVGEVHSTQLFSDADRVGVSMVNGHSMTLTEDGRRMYLAHNGGGFFVADTSAIADDRPTPVIPLITPFANHIVWPNISLHSTAKVPGRPYVITTDEVFGTYGFSPLPEQLRHGCPWGWSHSIDVSDPAKPKLIGEYKIEENTQAYCNSPAGRDPQNTTWTSFGSHSPTVLPDLAFSSWYAGGVQAWSIKDPAHPRQTGWFSPTPLAHVVTEDPAITRGKVKVAMWSFVVIKDGLLYVADVRNGLYVLRYTGPGHQLVDSLRFYEGNTNLGDAARLTRIGEAETRAAQARSHRRHGR